MWYDRFVVSAKENRSMLSQLRPAIVVLGLLTLITGVVYPVGITLIAQGLFSTQANGSVVPNAKGEAVGSSLIGQAFAEPRYFWSRPSATSPGPYNAAASSGSNLGPLNPALHEAVVQRIAALRAADPGNTRPVPVDLVTASGSGLDPEISPAAAEYQLTRVSRARGLAPEKVQTLVESHTSHRTLGVLGEPRVNVLQLNLALDALTP